MKRLFIACATLLLSSSGLIVSAQDIPTEYQQVLTTLGKQGDFKDNVLKVNIPRNDVTVTVAGVATPTPFGFGGWVALTKASDASQVLMGDLVLLQDEVNPVMSALLGRLRRHRVAGQLNTARIAQLVGHQGEQSGAVYKITIGRDDLKVTEMGATINARMGLNTWAAFTGTDAKAAVAGDVAMLDSEVTPVLKALRKNGLDVVAIHHHMTNERSMVVFLHYWGTGPTDQLAAGFKAALDQLGKPKSTAAKH